MKSVTLYVLSLLLLQLSLPPALGEMPVVGYLRQEFVDQIPDEAYDRVTDVCYFSIAIKRGGQADWSKLDHALLRKVRELTKKRDVKLHLSFGGWKRGAGFSEMVADPDKRQVFLDQLIRVVQKFDLDGIDYDWEYPKTQQDQQGYAKLTVETKQRLQPRGGIVSVAVPGWNKLHSDALEVLDRVYVMSYDHRDPAAGIAQSRADLENWRRQGVADGKLFLGMPFYGRKADRTAKSYREILDEFKPTPRQNEAGPWRFNGPQLIAAKTKWAAEEGLGGVFFWSMGHDHHEHEQSLLKAMRQAVDQATQQTNTTE